MIHYEKVQEERTKIKSKECDKCHRNFDVNNIDNICEIQEFIHIRNVGGYGSIFGDEVEIELDLCQHCVKEVLGQYLRIGPDWLEVEAEKWKKEEDRCQPETCAGQCQGMNSRPECPNLFEEEAKIWENW
jgi:antitoxin CcdA